MLTLEMYQGLDATNGVPRGRQPCDPDRPCQDTGAQTSIEGHTLQKVWRAKCSKSKWAYKQPGVFDLDVLFNKQKVLYSTTATLIGPAKMGGLDMIDVVIFCCTESGLGRTYT